MCSSDLREFTESSLADVEAAPRVIPDVPSRPAVAEVPATCAPRNAAASPPGEEALSPIEGLAKLVEPPIGILRDLETSSESDPEADSLDDVVSTEGAPSAASVTPIAPAPIRINPPRDLALRHGVRVSQIGRAHV